MINCAARRTRSERSAPVPSRPSMSARSRSRVFSVAAILFIMGCSLRASGANRKPVLLLHSGRVHPKPFSSKSTSSPPLFNNELVAILPAALGQVPKKVTPAFLAQCPLVLGSENSALRRTIADWLALASPPPRPLMEFDNVEAMKSVVAVGLGASIVPSLSLGAGHVSAANMLVRPLSPRASRQVGLVRLRGKRGTDGMELVSAALLTLRQRPAARSR